MSRIPSAHFRREEDVTDRLEELLCSTSDQKPEQTGSSQGCAAVGFTASWTSEELQIRQRKDPLMSKVLDSFLTMPGQDQLGVWRRSNRWGAIAKVWHQLALDDGVLHRFRKVGPAEGQEERQLLVVPDSMVPEVLAKLRNNGGHFGEEKTLNRVAERFWWPGCTRAVENYVASCVKCQQRKMPVKKTKAALQTVPVGGPFEMLAMDFLGPLPTTEQGNKYILVVADYFTKWTEAFPLQDQTAKTTAETLVNEVIMRFGMPIVLHSDQGRNFESALVREVCKLLGIRKSRTTAYHPQGDGLVERMNMTLVESLSKYVDTNQKDWDKWMATVLFAYCTSAQSSTGYSPYELLFGRTARLLVDTELDQRLPSPNTTDEYLSKLKRNLRQAKEIVDEEVTAAQKRQHRNYGGSEGAQYEVGVTA